MSAIGPGDYVECIDASPTLLFGATPFVTGALYRVVAVGEVPPGYTQTGEPVISLRGCPHPVSGRQPGWGVWRFRPIYRPRADLIERLMSPELENA